MVAAALEHWGRLDICVANAAIGVGGMFHRQPAGRSLAAEGAARGVLTNMLLPYALTQMTRRRHAVGGPAEMEPDAVAPALTALASERCRLNGSTSSPAVADCGGRPWWSGGRWSCRPGRS